MPTFFPLFRLVCFAALIFTGLAHAEQHRAALVIGNGNYPSSPLANPVNDALDVAAQLQKLGFDVTQVTDASQRDMTRAITAFGSKLKPDSVALFYYAGHGIQAKGKNYLLPVDASVQNEASLRSEGVDVDAVLEQIAATGSQVNIVILDACRNNPFERKFRSAGSGGLAQIDAPKGTLIAYATAPGKTAADGSGKNGLYTSQLLRALQQPGARVEEVFKKVRIEVARSSNDAQIPWESSSLTGDFFFLPPHSQADVTRLLEQASAAFERRDLPEVIAKSQAILTIDPRETTALANLAAAHLVKGQYREAGALAEQALGINPYHAPSFNHRGLVREKFGQFVDALTDYQRGCELKSAQSCLNANRLSQQTYLLR